MSKNRPLGFHLIGGLFTFAGLGLILFYYIKSATIFEATLHTVDKLIVYPAGLTILLIILVTILITYVRCSTKLIYKTQEPGFQKTIPPAKTTRHPETFFHYLGGWVTILSFFAFGFWQTTRENNISRTLHFIWDKLEINSLFGINLYLIPGVIVQLVFVCLLAALVAEIIRVFIYQTSKLESRLDLKPA